MPEPLDLDSLNLDPLPKQEQEQTPETQPDSLAEGFLKDIKDEQHRAIIAPYVSEWDKKVGQRFRAIHEEYAPFKELGSLESVQTSLAFIAELNNNPAVFIDSLYELLVTNGIDVPLTRKELKEVVDDIKDDLEEELNDLPPSALKIIKELKSEVGTLKETVGKTEQERQEAREKEQLDNYLKEMHNEHGEFDEDYILAKLARGLEFKDALAQFRKLQGNTDSTPKPKLPPAKVIGGNGANGHHPQEQARKPFKDASERKRFVLEALMQANAD